MPRFHEKIVKRSGARAVIDISGNGSQRDEDQIARATLDFSRKNEWPQTDSHFYQIMLCQRFQRHNSVFLLLLFPI